MISRLKRLLAVAGVTASLAFIGGLAMPQPVAAAGEVFTWKDNRTITVSGGDVKTPSDILLTNAAVTGDQSAIFAGNILYNKGRGDKGCTVSIQIYLFKASGNGAGRTWNPPPYDGPVAGDPNAAPRCSTAGAPEMDAPMHDKWIAIAGTRPGDTSAPEREEEKRWDVYVFAPDPLSKVPPSDTVFIYKSDGTLVGQQASPFKDDSGAADWPPDQTPASMRVTFNLEPGDYVVCDTYVAKECSYAKASIAQKFKKEKYKAGSINLGTPFQTPDKKRINGKVEYHTKRACGATLNQSPVGVELTGPGGIYFTTQTNAAEARPNANEEGALCTVNVVFGLQITPFENMPPGSYKACTTGAECVTFTKVDGEPATFTLVVMNEMVAPPNEKVCTSGEGIAGALAWAICPAIEIIAKSTTFFEENIIVPFMTVSPLTTNNDNPIYILWRSVRDVSNVGLVLLLFITIFSIALSKYGLKRVLPRLLIVAIGINLSYFIVGLVIDAFNIFGAGVSQLVMSALQGGNVTQLNSGTSSSPASMFALGGAALATIILTGGAALGWLFSFIAVAALIIVAIVVLLIARQLAIIMLVIVSPAAILAYLLPNTESLTSKWRNLLITLLAMYPLIVLLFATGKIFGFLLQQPDFTIVGDGINEDVAQGIRVVLQLLAYVLPIAFLPGAFMATSAGLSKIMGFIANKNAQKFLQKPGQAISDNARLRRQESLARAANRNGAIGKIAGFGMRREFKKERREHELSEAREHYLAKQAANERFAISAAGIGGTEGARRVRAEALNAQEKARKEEESNESALLQRELRRIGISNKSLNTGLAEYLNDPTKSKISGTAFDAAGKPIEVDLAQRQDLMRAALNNAASAGEIGTIENARLSPVIDQVMLDEVIRDNEGELKGKGGYHLATNFGMGYNRDTKDISGAAIDYSSPAVAANQLRQVMQQRRIIAMSQSGAKSIAAMKKSVLADTASVLDPSLNPGAANLMASLTTAQKDALRARLNEIITDSSTLNKSEGPKEIKRIHALL